MCPSNLSCCCWELGFPKSTAEYFWFVHQNLHLVHFGLLKSTQPFSMLLYLHICICVVGLPLCCWIGSHGVFLVSCWTFTKEITFGDWRSGTTGFTGVKHRRARGLRRAPKLFLYISTSKQYEPSNIKQCSYASVRSPPAQSDWS